MADIRINALATTAASTASDDFVAVDGSANGTRKLNAYSPTFGGNLTVSGTTSTITLGSTNTGSIAVDSNGGLTITPKAGQALTLAGASSIKAGVGYAGLAEISNGLYFGGASYAFAQGDSGDTYVNAKSGQSVYLRVNNTTVAQGSAGAFSVAGNLTVSGTGGITSSSTSPLLKATTSALGAVPKLTLENTNLGAWNVYLSGTDGGDFKIDQDSTNKFRIAFGTGNATLAGNLTVSGGTIKNEKDLGLSTVENIVSNTNATGFVANTFKINSSEVGKVIGNSSGLTLRNSVGGTADYVFGQTALTVPGNLTVSGTGNSSVAGTLLVATTTNSSNGKIQLADHTTSAGGIGFGTDTAFYRVGAGQLVLYTTSYPILSWNKNGTFAGDVFVTNDANNILTVSGNYGLNLKTNGAYSMTLQTNSTTALTLDSSQNATFAGYINLKSVTTTPTVKNILAAGNYSGTNNVLNSRCQMGADTNGDYGAWFGASYDGAQVHNWVGTRNGGTDYTLIDLMGGGSPLVKLGGALRLNNAYVAGAPTATGYVTIQDSAGNTYKVLVGT